MSGPIVTIQGEFPPGHPLADTHQYAFELGPAILEDGSTVWPVQNVRVELMEAPQERTKETP